MIAIFDILNLIFLCIGILGVIGFVLEIPLAITFAVLYSKQKENSKKQKIKKWAIVTLVAPFVMIIPSLLLTAVMSAIKVLGFN